jgi:hypothetical protein
MVVVELISLAAGNKEFAIFPLPHYLTKQIFLCSMC